MLTNDSLFHLVYEQCCVDSCDRFCWVEGVEATEALNGRWQSLGLIRESNRGHIFVLLRSNFTQNFHVLFEHVSLSPCFMLINERVFECTFAVLHPADDIIFVFGRDVEVRRCGAALSRPNA